jgi:hypothetical protein
MVCCTLFIISIKYPDYFYAGIYIYMYSRVIRCRRWHTSRPVSALRPRNSACFGAIVIIKERYVQAAVLFSSRNKRLRAVKSHLLFDH